MKTNKSIYLTGIIITIFLLIPGISLAGVEFTSLDPLNLPQDMAVATDGKVYVVDGSRGQILIYDRKGQPAGSISMAKPTSVAVGSNGNIYIGTNKDLSVKILDSAHNIIGTLGTGAGEFKLPRNITIDAATGNIYVVDQLDNSIKVYTPTGAFLSKIDDYPNQPQDATIMDNEIYVIDFPLNIDSSGGTMRGAECQVFDMSGSPVRHFGSYGAQEGQFIRPAGITSGTDGIATHFTG
jgi:DNA-binding beta-propeller fold protein YncE